MSKRICLDCKAITDRHASGRCPDCRRAKDRARGTRQARGYDATHEAERKRWVPIVASGRVACARCGETIVGAFDLDHTAERDGYLGPSHPSCNRAAH